MKNVYLFNAESGEYAATAPYDDKNPLPENGTLIEVPKVKKNQVAVFDRVNKVWTVKKDYRFTHKMLDTKNNILDIEDLGDIPADYKLITLEQAEALERQKYIEKLHITKYDFYTNFCAPAGISYDNLIKKVEELGMKPAWELCNHVYYGIIKPFFQELPIGKTEAEIIAIFEEIMAKSES